MLARIVVFRTQTLVGRFLAIRRDNLFTGLTLARCGDIEHDGVVGGSPDSDKMTCFHIAVANPRQGPVDAQPLGQIESKGSIIFEAEHAAACSQGELIE